LLNGFLFHVINVIDLDTYVSVDSLCPGGE
jgi:hypothetical protein